MNTDPTSLDRLHDIIVPTPVPWWPPAPGWWWVMGAALLFLLAVSFRAFARWQHNRYRREALGRLAILGPALKDPSRRGAALLEMAELLKRTALTAWPRDQVASLTGPDWFKFLDRTGRGTRFSDGLGELLESAVHDPRTVAALEPRQIEEMTTQIHQWIKTHTADTASATTKPSLPPLSSVESPC